MRCSGHSIPHRIKIMQIGRALQGYTGQHLIRLAPKITEYLSYLLRPIHPLDLTAKTGFTSFGLQTITSFNIASLSTKQTDPDGARGRHCNHAIINAPDI